MLDIDLVLLESDSASFGQSMYQGPVYIVVIMVNRVRNADDVNNHLELRPVKRKITEKKRNQHPQPHRYDSYIPQNSANCYCSFYYLTHKTLDNFRRKTTSSVSFVIVSHSAIYTGLSVCLPCSLQDTGNLHIISQENGTLTRYQSLG